MDVTDAVLDRITQWGPPHHLDFAAGNQPQLHEPARGGGIARQADDDAGVTRRQTVERSLGRIGAGS